MKERQPLRFCHVVYSFYETDNRVIRYAETLAAEGDLADVIALRRPGQGFAGMSNGVRVYRIQRRSRSEGGAWVYLLKILWFWVKAFALLSLVAWRKRYDVVHVHNVPDFLVFVAVVPKLLGAKIILDIHDLVPELYVGKFGGREKSVLYRGLLFAERLSCRFADHVIIANHLWHDRVIRRSVAPSRCTAILNYPDVELFRPAPSHVVRRTPPFLFLYPGTLNHHQGVDIAVAAFAKVVGKMPGAEFHIYGEGPARDLVQQQANSLGIRDRISINDPVPLHDVPRLMASADVGVVPKRADGFGNEAFSTKILEFMACGVPVIVSRTKIDAHYFDDQAVLFFTPGDAADLADRMLWAYEHPSELNLLAASANRYALESSWQRHAQEYLEIVHGLTCTGQVPFLGELEKMRHDGAPR